MWTDEKSRIFIEAEYPWFLETFDGYPHPIQRADVIRYFVLAHFGGVYIDLDDVGLLSLSFSRLAHVCLGDTILLTTCHTRAATDVSTLFCHSQHGSEARSQPASRTTSWVRCHNIHSSSASWMLFRLTIETGYSLISPSCIRPARSS